jgi:integrase
MKTPRFPVSIRRGSVVTRVYRLQRADGREIFTASWNAGGQRLTRQFSSYAEAHAEATFKAEQLAAGRVNAAVTLSGDDAGALAEARRLCGSVPFLAAVREWARARDLTDGHVIAAAEAWKARNSARIARRKVCVVVDEFCRAKTAAGFKVADDHSSIFDSIRDDLGDEFIDLVSARRLETWLAQRENAVSRNTYRKRIVSVWRWAQKRGYLPRDVKTEAEQTERAREEAPEIGIISAATWARVLELVRATAPELIACAVGAGFCGLRRNEIHGQTWEDINLEQRFLRVTKAKRGTPARRLLPLSEAAVQWLLLGRDREGLIGPSFGLDRLRKLAREAKPAIDLPENCFRHSYISHRVAATGSVAETALEAGNSPQIVHRHYRELVTKAEGVAWFATAPAVAGEVIALTAS